MSVDKPDESGALGWLADGSPHRHVEQPRPSEPEGLREKVIDALRTVYDPEIPVNIYELGLVYDVRIDGEGGVKITMSLTSPGCPVAGSMPAEVEARVSAVPGVTDVKAEVVWDPPWCPDMMTEAARLELGML
ncbi:MAG: SUF system Fe-S cluster assembly protein [Alphaproteobacteria bacterium]